MIGGALMIGGELLTMEGVIDGALYTPSGSTEEATHAYGTIVFEASTAEHYFGGTYAAKR